MIFDSHVHSMVSPDSGTKPTDAVNESRSKNLGIIFTEHVDYVTPIDKADPNAPDLPKANRDFMADFSVYPARYEKFRAKDVRLGLEVGLTKAFTALNKETAEQYEYDFILGSIHFVDGYDIYNNYFNQDVADHYGRMLAYTREMLEVADYIDSLAHIDYISRVSPFAEKNVLYELYKNEYDAVLSILAERGLAIEINTARLNETLAAQSLFKVYERFREVGGRYVTVGSDAHVKQNIGRNFDAAKKIADEAGLTIVSYKARKRYE